ncbi:TRAP transporter small permease [Mesorhizobium microcysteis]|uniref:TRAP transporter small permease protein n=1 Tax=Neoaquamicrobium microcysteis TaxID=2682781 RepID=A0A5D4GYS6_9HYPH|nr:TRAP transporter small permease [Mesorhizobium microcysteis]TYR33202.1 TRAP transporter small permease [Mesorhizobium microcysteis]
MLRRLGQIEFAVAVVLLAGTTLLVFMAAVMRFFGQPLIWSVDMAQLLFIWLCFIGAARAMREKGHLGVDLLVRRAPYQHRLAVETAVTLLIVAFLAVLAVEGTKLTWLNRQRVFGDSGLSYAFVTVAVPVGCVMLCGALFHNLVQAWTRRDGETLIYTKPDDEITVSAGRQP